MFFTNLFARKKQVVNATPMMRRLIDITTPDYLRGDDSRSDRRYMRTLSVAIWPWVGEIAVRDQMALGVTKDVSDAGLSVMTPKPLEMDTDIVLAFLIQEEESEVFPCFRGSIVRAGKWAPFWEYGINIEEYLNHEYGAEAMELTRLLLSGSSE